MDGTSIETEVKPTKKLFIGVPVYGGVDPHFFKCWSHLVASNSGQLPYPLILYPHCGDSLVSRARNHVTRMFLESDATHLLFIDSDLVFSSEHITRIMSHDLDIVGGVYCKKSEGDVQVVCNSVGKSENRPSGVSEVGYIGTGFLCVSRKVFEVMIQEFGKDIWYLIDPDHTKREYDFWHTGVYDYGEAVTPRRRYLSEDWWFCQKAMDVGFRVWMDMGVILGHSGNAIYPLSYQKTQLLAKHTKSLLDEVAKPSGAADAVPSIPAETVPVN